MISTAGISTKLHPRKDSGQDFTFSLEISKLSSSTGQYLSPLKM